MTTNRLINLYGVSRGLSSILQKKIEIFLGTRPILKRVDIEPATQLEPEPVDSVIHNNNKTPSASIDELSCTENHLSDQELIVDNTQKISPATSQNIKVEENSDYPTTKKSQKQLSEAKVPTSKFSRLFQYTSLAASLGAGTATEAIKRSLGFSKSESGESSMWNEANVERIVKRLSLMRGAAQKLGQILSIQDSNVLPPQIEQILFGIQHSGTQMPKAQLLEVLRKELGESWQERLLEFDMAPFAAASIGQVHLAKVDGNPVVVKVQYPGVAQSIDSDLDTLRLLLIASRILPRGLYLENSIRVARQELKWETDYKREAHYAKKFAQVFENDNSFRVPKIYQELSTDMVLTMERLEGVPLSETIQLDQKTRNWIAEKLLKLSLHEVFEFKFMQTDPNWSNFLFDATKQQIGLLDFGATREFDDDFLQNYLYLLQAGVANDREGCYKYSLALGYLTGHEHNTMVDAHIDSILTLAEPFQHTSNYNFAGQTVTERVRAQIPIMLQMRLTPPPEPTYSLHRKLSGCFLLCARLNASINANKIFKDATASFRLTN